MQKRPTSGSRPPASRQRHRAEPNGPGYPYENGDNEAVGGIHQVGESEATLPAKAPFECRWLQRDEYKSETHCPRTDLCIL